MNINLFFWKFYINIFFIKYKKIYQLKNNYNFIKLYNSHYNYKKIKYMNKKLKILKIVKFSNSKTL